MRITAIGMNLEDDQNEQSKTVLKLFRILIVGVCE